MGVITKRQLTALLTGTLIAANTFSMSTHYSNLHLKNAYQLTSTTVYASSYDYANYQDLMTETNIQVPIYNAMVPQGLTKVNDNFLMSSYDYSKTSPSTIYIYDNNGNLVNECPLDNKSHVGGISYDQKNDLIWVASSSGYINSYPCSSIFNSSQETKYQNTFNVGEGCKNYIYPWKNAISYLSVDNNYLYVGSFSLYKNGLVKKYLIENKDGDINLSLVNTFKVPTKVQGLTIYHKNDQDYLILSRSFGENNPSILQIYKYQEDIDDYTNPQIKSVCYKTDAMMEQIIIDNDYLYAVFESSAYPYRYSPSSADHLQKTDMSLVLLPK